MAQGDTRERKWKGNWRMEWVASTLHTTSEHGASSITTADAHTSVASGQMKWRPRRFKWTRPFLRKTNSGFCACAITFQLASATGCIILHAGCRTNRGHCNRVQMYLFGTDAQGKLIINWASGNEGVTMWNWFNWLRMETSVRVSWTR